MGEWKDLNISSTDVDLNSRLITLEEQYELVEYYYTITSGTTGTVTIPTGYTIEMDRFAEGIDGIIAKEGTDSRPINQAVYTANGVLISTTLAANGAYVLSGIPSAYNVCLVYYLKGQRKYRNNLIFANILDSTEYLVTPDQLDKLKFTTAGIYVAPSYVDNNNGSITIGIGEYVLFTNGTTNPPIKYTIAGGTFTCTDQVNNYLVANYNGGTPVIQMTASRANIDQITVVPIYTIFRNGIILTVIDWDELTVALANKMADRLVRTERFAVEPGGLLLSETGTRNVVVTDGYVWTGAIRTYLNSFNSTTNDLVFYYPVVGVWTKSVVTQYNNTQYSNGTNLVSTASGKYIVNWLWELVSGTTRKVYYIVGTADYNLAQAQASTIPTDIPPEIQSTGILLGRIIVKQGDPTAYEINSAFETVLNLAPVNDHSHLTNLDYANAGHTGFQAALSNPVTGTGTTNKMSKFTSTSTIGNSNIEDTGIVVKIPVVTNIGDGGTTNYSQFEATGTLKLNGSALYWKDVDFPIVIRTTGVGIPTLTTLNGNLTMPQWAVNDFNMCESQEFVHEWLEGSTCYWHLHLNTNGTDGTDRYVKFELEYGYTDSNSTWTFPAVVTTSDLLIPANTPTKTQIIMPLANFTPTGTKIAGHVIARLKRVASVGTAPTNNPWIPMLQMHIQCDTLGSRQMTSK